MLVKHVPLSDTIVCGSPNLANTVRRQLIVVDDVCDEVRKISIHFECASTIIRKVDP